MTDIVRVKYAVVDSSGKIVRMGDTSPDMLAAQADEGELALNVTGLDISDDTHYFRDNSFMPIPARPASYGDWAVYDFIKRRWMDPRTPEFFEREFNEGKNSGLLEVNNWAHKIRRQYVTPIEGQTTVYQLKKDEAERFVADANPDLVNYPLISAEIGITADTAENVAEVYLQLNDIFMSTLAKVEGIRLGYIAQLEKAETIGAVNTIIEQFRQVGL